MSKKIIVSPNGVLQYYNDVTVITFKEGVANVAALPSSGNETNDGRFTADTGNLYIWDGSSWQDQGDILDIDWSALVNKPSSSVSDIDDAVSKKHSHTNKTTLDAIQEAFTTALKSAYDSCVTNEHTHSNKATLDSIQEAFTTALKNKLDGIEASAVALSTVKSDIDISDAISKKHSHSNKTELDKVTDGDHDVIVSGNPHSVSKSDVGLGNVDNKSEATIITDVKADTDVADAISKKHSQGTDQALDTGGANEISAANAKSAYTHSGLTSGNPHSVSKSDVGLGNVSNVDTTKLIVELLIDGQGSAITTGIKGDIRIPVAGNISKVSLLADQSGNLVIDIWKSTYANFDGGSSHPVDGDSITASAQPTISSGTKSEDSTLTGWTKSIDAGDILRFNVDSCSTITRVTLILEITRT